MARLFRDQGEFDDANAHIVQAKSHAGDDAYNLGCGMEMQARIWDRQCKLEEARSEALGALEIYERIGATRDAEGCRALLRRVEKGMGTRRSGKLDSSVPGAVSSIPTENSQGAGQGTGRTSHS